MEQPTRDAELDRLCELANIGAGHAATAFSRLTGRTIRMRVPRVRRARSREDVAPVADEPWATGAFFTFEGYLDALVGVLFRASASEAIARTVVGEATGPLPRHSVESALMEVGNILASHVASAIADTVGVRLLPSIPTLAMERADEELDELVARRGGEEPVYIECELVDDEGELGGLLVLVSEAGRV